MEGDFDFLNSVSEQVLESPREQRQPEPSVAEPQVEPSRNKISDNATAKSKHVIRWEHTVIKVAFLEDSEKKNFVGSIKELDPVKVMGITKYNKDFQFEYLYMMKSQIHPACPVSEDKYKIVFVKQVYTKKLINVWYPIFTVTRQDDKEWMFSEADFSLLELEDLEFLYNEFRQRTIRPQDIIIALNDVTRFMRRHVKYSYIADLRTGCESNQKKINLLRPDQSLPNIENFQVLMILEVQEFGVVL